MSNWLSDPSHEGRHVRTLLKTNERVIARVTDGIYRQPGSALRELISNAWDADAKTVTVLTDAPRFSKIYVRDDGAGMSYKTLSRLLHNIGGSAKRREDGQDLGITSTTDVDRTPCGRPLIGKIGIGLFSVSQLSRRFRIVTKVRGENYRLIAEIRLRAYSEDSDNTTEADDTFHNGEVVILREHSKDLEAHGTDIILDQIKPRVRDLLRDAERWRRVEERQRAYDEGDLDAALSIRTEPPTIHAGWLGDADSSDLTPDTFSQLPQLPWDANDPADVRMSKLMEEVEQLTTRTVRPDLDETLDAYLNMLWKLALACPVPYVDRHPFDLMASDQIRLFWLSNASRGQASELELRSNETVREAVKRQADGHPTLESGADDPVGGFKVLVDGVELRRPIKFRFFQPDSRSIDHGLLFVGKYQPSLSSVPASMRGGFLNLEGYLFWNGRIIPKDNNGVLIRIRGAGGGLFDPTFFQYQVSEQTRLRQITSEIFVVRGLDAALNIDRESFNFSHPHVQLVTSWLHRSLRQLTNRHKDIASRKRSERNASELLHNLTELEKYTNEVWHGQRGIDLPPEIRIESTSDRAQELRRVGVISYASDEMSALSQGIGNASEKEAQARAVASVLSAFGLLEGRSYQEQQSIINALLSVFIRFRS